MIKDIALLWTYYQFLDILLKIKRVKSGWSLVERLHPDYLLIFSTLNLKGEVSGSFCKILFHWFWDALSGCDSVMPCLDYDDAKVKNSILTFWYLLRTAIQKLLPNRKVSRSSDLKDGPLRLNQPSSPGRHSFPSKRSPKFSREFKHLLQLISPIAWSKWAISLKQINWMLAITKTRGQQ